MLRRTTSVILVCLVLLPAGLGQVLRDGRDAVGPISRASLEPVFKQHQALADGEVKRLQWGDWPGPGTGVDFDHQFYIDVPQGSESLLIAMRAQDVTKNFQIIVRYGQPVEAITDEQGNIIDVAADWFGFSTRGLEEFSAWLGGLKVGPYYVALGTASPVGGVFSVWAKINGALIDIASGESVAVEVSADPPVDMNPPNTDYIEIDGQQYRLTVPEGAKEIYLRFESQDLTLDPWLSVNYVEPVTAFSLINLGGGFEEFCLTEIMAGQEFYIWVLNNSNDRVLSGTLEVTIDGCIVPLEVGEARQDVARAIEHDQIVDFLGARQFEVSVPDPTRELTITVTPLGDPADLDFIVRFTEPIAEGEHGAIFDYATAMVGTEPEAMVLTCGDLTPGDKLYINVSNPNDRPEADPLNDDPIKYTILVTQSESLCAILFKRGDSNGDGRMNVADAVYILQNLFSQGPAILCKDAADANDDEGVNVADAVYILQNLFAQGPAIPPPGTNACGLDETGHPTGGVIIGCDSYAECP